MDDIQTWEGFSFPDKDFFKVPNDFVEIMAHIGLSELKVILYVMRHTWGFQEFDVFKEITTDEFMNGRMLSDRTRMDSGTGLSDRGVKDGIIKAIEHGFLECEVDDKDKARVKKSYRLKLKYPCEETENVKVRPASPRIKDLKTMPYSEYLQTPEWKEKRKKALRFARFKCQLCNSAERLNVHHRTYERLGQELMGDLITLCNDCHGIFHQNRNLAD